jgi:hypothetical protein
LGLTEEVVPLTWKYFFVLHLERTKKDNMNTTLKIKEEESEEKENQVKMAHQEEAEEVEDKDHQDKIKHHKSLNKKPHRQQHESNVTMYIYLIENINNFAYQIAQSNFIISFLITFEYMKYLLLKF